MVSQSARCFKSSVLGFGGKKVGLVLLMTLSNVLGPTDRVCRCPPCLGGSDCEEIGGEVVELCVGVNPDVVADEACPREPDENTVFDESGVV